MTPPDLPWKRTTLTRRRLLSVAALAALAPGAHLAMAAGAVLPVAASLPDQLTQALQKGKPLVVMVSLKGCPFCEVARNNYLAPLQRDGQIEVVQVNMLTPSLLTDFQGKALTHEQLVRQWSVNIAPTVLFFGKGGAEVADRLVGGYLPDFYGSYLESRLQQAGRAVRS